MDMASLSFISQMPNAPQNTLYLMHTLPELGVVDGFRRDHQLNKRDALSGLLLLLSPFRPWTPLPHGDQLPLAASASGACNGADE